jgi:two-component system chemotaxis response regulator CheB
MSKLNALIADDSIVSRSAVKAVLLETKVFEKVDSVNNGQEAIDFVKKNSVDLIIMDLEMPVMGGIEAIAEIRKFNREVKIIIFSAQSEYGIKRTLLALEHGASDFVQKSQGGKDLVDNIKRIKVELLPKILGLLKARLIEKSNTTIQAPILTKTENRMSFGGLKPDLLLIGCSTGGPEALKKVIPKLMDPFPRPILLVQHMPPMFTQQLANFLTSISKHEVLEAKDGMLLENNKVYLAPGDYHMELISTIDNKYKIRLNQEAKVCYVRPAFDVLCNSVAQNFKGKVQVLVMTGMGEDGLKGIQNLKAKLTAQVMIQDKASSVVWGMPGILHQNNLQDSMFSIDEIADQINQIFS